MKKPLIFVFGRDPELAMLELVSYCMAEETGIEATTFNSGYALAEGKEKEARKALQALGGTAKIGEVLFKGTDLMEGIKALETRINFLFIGKKAFFALNDLGEGSAEKECGEISGFLKKCFKENKIKASEKHPRKKGGFIVEPSKVQSWGLAESGLDILVAKQGTEILIGKSIAVSNPKAFKKRENKRPFQRELHTSSIRLSRILANLSMAGKGQALLDPFCGIGTILQEAMLRERNAVGVEKEESVAVKAKENLEWVKKEFGLKAGFTIISGDSTRLSELVGKGKFGAVATEPYLGPFISSPPTSRQAAGIAQNLEGLYNKFFRELAKIAFSGMKIVFIFPRIPTREGKKANISEKVFFGNGFRKFNAAKGLGVKLPVVYKKKTSRIERLVYVLEFGNSKS